MPKPRSQARELDQFDTVSKVAQECTNFLKAFLASNFTNQKFTWIEPSAGKGNFLAFMPKSTLALDISPRDPKIFQANFLDWVPSALTGHKKSSSYLVLGNPPFGKNSSLALKFLNHAGEFADIVAFILPRTFEKESFQAKVCPNLHLVKEKGLTSIVFEHEAKQVAIPVVFQIWQKLPQGQQRVKTKPLSLTHPDFQFVADPKKADFAFQRVGAAAGLASTAGLHKAKTSHYFIKANVKGVVKIIQGIDWNNVKYKTAGNPSISKRELVQAYDNIKAGVP